MADKMEFKFFNTILNCQNLFVDHMVILFRVFELSARMCAKMTYAINVFEKDGTPIIITGISLEDALSTCGTLNTDHTSTDSEFEYADLTTILMATKTKDPSASTTTPIVEDSSSDDQKEATTELVPQMPPPVTDHSTKPSSAFWRIKTGPF